MIVRDGGKNFACLLAEAQNWVDEIVVGDTGSNDDSVTVAKKHDALLLEFPWQDDFAAARNRVLEACTSNWIVVLDADEQLSPQDWQHIRNWVNEQTRGESVVAGSFITRNYLIERYGRRGWQPVPHPDPFELPNGAPSSGYSATNKVRLFPNRPSVRFQGRIHETVEASLREAHIRVVPLPWPIHHFGYLQQNPDKKRRYLHLAHLKTTDQPHCGQAWAELADCAIGMNNHAQALVAIERSLLLEPSDPEIRLTAGWILQEVGKFSLADEQLVAVAGMPEVALHVRAEASHLRAQIAIKCDRPLAALPLLTSALRLLPDNGHFHNTLGSLNLILGRGEPALVALTRASQLLPNLAEPCLNLAAMWESAGQLNAAAKQYAEALRRDPKNESALAGLQKNTPQPAY
ncbi:MAG: tetratricopeptide (TPR) repeat protein [Candidatus Krumholzibacteriia bacterium]|jgi:tetratricopeptide (TPR) repeat protein